MNLYTAITNRIEALGGPESEAAIKFFGVTKGRLAKWYGGTEQPNVGAAQKILDEEIEAGRVVSSAFAAKPAPKLDLASGVTTGGLTVETLTIGAHAPVNHPVQILAGESSLATLSPEELAEQITACCEAMPLDNRVAALQILSKDLPRRVSICLPTTRDINPAVFLSVLGLSKSLRVASFEMVKDTLIHKARNLLAEKFLASKAEWSLWIDSDMIIPFGNAAYFKGKTGSKIDDKFAGMNALNRLTQGAEERTIIGGVYCSRSPARTLLIQPELNPRGEDDKTLCEAIRKNGPSNKLVEVDWLAFGLVAVHRSVFEDIKAQMPELAAKKKGMPFNFFSLTTDDEGQDVGEDVLFCRRAKQAGHQSWLDLGLHAAHIGNQAFLP